MAVLQHAYPLNFKLIQKEQQKDKAFLKVLKKSKTKYNTKVFQGADKSRSLICQEDIRLVPYQSMSSRCQAHGTYYMSAFQMEQIVQCCKEVMSNMPDMP
eukprot:14207374-Ditylum_brightwellii.AAC.1